MQNASCDALATIGRYGSGATHLVGVHGASESDDSNRVLAGALAPGRRGEPLSDSVSPRDGELESSSSNESICFDFDSV